MKYLNRFNSNTEFDNDKFFNKNQPRVALVEENGGGVDTVHYIKFKLYEYVESSLINGLGGNYISVEDIPVKTTVQDFFNDETIRTIDYSRTRMLINVYLPNYYSFSYLSSELTVTSDSLDLIDNGKLVTKFTLTGLKRKDSDERDFVGEIACYLEADNKPFLFKVDRTNADHPTVTYLDKYNSDFSKYMNNHEVEKRIKGIMIYNDNL